MQGDPVSSALGDPAGFLQHIDWLATLVSLIAGLAAPWICGRLLQRKLGCLANLAVGILVSSLAYWLMEEMDGLFKRSPILDLLVLAFVGVAVMLVRSMRQP